MTMIADAFEVYRCGKWVRIAPEQIVRGEHYRRMRNGVRVSAVPEIGPVDMDRAAVDPVIEQNVNSAPVDSRQDRPVGKCWGLVCDHAMSGYLDGYEKITFLKCAKANGAPVKDMQVCPLSKWRRNWKGEATIDGREKI